MIYKLLLKINTLMEKMNGIFTSRTQLLNPTALAEIESLSYSKKKEPIAFIVCSKTCSHICFVLLHDLSLMLR